MEPEKLKVINQERLCVIYKGMGWKPDLVFLNGGESDLIYPPINNDQMVEIMEKMKISVGWNRLYLLWNAQTMTFSKSEEGKTINEAVCNAVYEYFRDQNEL